MSGRVSVDMDGFVDLIYSNSGLPRFPIFRLSQTASLDGTEWLSSRM